MTLRGAYAWGFALTIEWGLLSVLMGGALPPWVWPAVLAPLLSAGLKARDRALPGMVGTVIAVAAFAAAGIVVAMGGLEVLLIGGGVALVGLLVGRLLTRQTLAHDLQALVLSLLLIFAGSVLHTELTYGVVFLCYAVCAAWALVTRELVRGATEHGERAAAGTLARRDIITGRFAIAIAGLAVLILAATSLLFVLFPRLGFTNLGFFARERFPSGVSLTRSPRAAGGGAVMARVWGVSYQSFERGLYLRGPVYDALTGDGFERSEAPSRRPPPALVIPRGTERSTYHVFMQSGLGQTLLILGPVIGAYTLSGGTANPSLRQRILGTGPSGELLAGDTVTGPVRYAVDGGIVGPGAYRGLVGSTAPPAGRAWDLLQPYLALGPDLDPRIPQLAQRLVRDAGAVGGTNPEKAAALRRYLAEGFDYTLDQPNSDAADPLAAFLFDHPRGHCEFFATAYATLLRAAGIPSRVVGGFWGGKWDGEPGGDGVVIFTSGDAHAWVEWFDSRLGWVVDDATPASLASPQLLTGIHVLLERIRRTWDDYVVDYSVHDQFRILGRVAGAVDSPLTVLTERLSWRYVISVAAGVVLALLVFTAVRRERRRRATVHPLARSLLALVERRTGEPVEPASTLREAVDGVCLEMGDEDQTRRLILDALAVYEQDRFSRRVVDRAQLNRLVAGLRRI